MPKEIITESFIFQGFHGSTACDYHLFESDSQVYCLIEQLQETTTSITHRIEDIILGICEVQGIMYANVRFYEYYPKGKLALPYIYELRRVYLDDQNKPLWRRPTPDIERLVSGMMA